MDDMMTDCCLAFDDGMMGTERKASPCLSAGGADVQDLGFKPLRGDSDEQRITTGGIARQRRTARQESPGRLHRERVVLSNSFQAALCFVPILPCSCCLATPLHRTPSTTKPPLGPGTSYSTSPVGRDVNGRSSLTGSRRYCVESAKRVRVTS